MGVLYVRGCLKFVAFRHKRLYYLAEGVPAVAWRGLNGKKQEDAAAAKFKLLDEAYARAVTLEDPGERLRKMLLRAVMPTTPVQQLLHGTRESDWKYSEGITEVSKRFVYGMHTSNVIELINNMQGNNGQCRRTMRWRRPERSMAVALSCNVLGEGGRYPLSSPEPEVPVRKSVVKLAKEAFGKGNPSCSLDLTGICSQRSSTTWYSPVAAAIGLPYADLAVFTEAFKRNKDASVFERAIAGCFCVAEAQVVFKRKGDGDFNFSWHVPLCHYWESGAVAYSSALLGKPAQEHLPRRL